MEMTGAQLLVRLLEAQGVDTIAGIPGGAALPLYDALASAGTIRHVLARHEQGAGFIAQGMARATGKPGVCLASSGPGATNLVTAIADAKLDSIPLVCITGQVPLSMIGTDAFQEVDTYGLSIPVTKHNYLVRRAEDLPQVISDAFRIAQSGRPGPVWVDVPKDVQTQRVDAPALTACALDRPPEVSEEAVLRAAEMINRAERPVLYLGGGVIASGASHLATTLAEQAGLPTTMTLMALGAMPVDHPLSVGMLGMHGARYTNYVLQEADLLICVGARFDDRAIGKAAQFCPDAKIIHVDIDASEIDKIKTAHIGIQGDVAAVLERLLPHVQVQLRKKWLSRVNSLRSAHPLQMPGLDDPRSHYGLVSAVAACLDDEAIITTDVGQHQMWVAQAYPFRRPRQWLTSGGLGTMGFGLPAAIGAALAEPGRKVVCFSGDGSLQMNIQEMATAADEGVDVKIILMNNQSLGLVHQQQDMFYGQRIFAADYKRPTDFIRIAQGFGLEAVDLDRSAHPRATLAEALASKGPMLIHCSIDVNQKVFPMVPPGAANIEMIGG
ncbi:acetolactate synthase large subunit [Niveibacterium microcysteis]|uniref:Acetolactate synthase n=1 Tax=Niveibacterium microcysteis TaxID=2811415 RepID=A0ABX7M4Q5_9RHOO|nr:acetolactate synthase large subunit [Niveibacterium microcysteis]QSI75430.1 acetolactate synthase large subunit [Niveibacterium microcysteis]